MISVIEPKKALKIIIKPNITVIIPLIVNINDFPKAREKLINENPRRRNQIPTIMRNMATPAATCPISTKPSIKSTTPKNICQPRLVSVLSLTACSNSPNPAIKMINPKKKPNATKLVSGEAIIQILTKIKSIPLNKNTHQ